MKIDTVIYKILKYLYETSDEAMPSMEPIMPLLFFMKKV